MTDPGESIHVRISAEDKCWLDAIAETNRDSIATTAANLLHKAISRYRHVATVAQDNEARMGRQGKLREDERI